jgi:uncharacterized protein YbbC (DUF1343 family)
MAAKMSKETSSGLDRLLGDAAPVLEGSRIGLIVHPASVSRCVESTARLLIEDPRFDVRALFGPQHGARGEKQDNMIESASFVDAETALPVFSLYGEVRKPTPHMLQGLDALVFDLQDVGVRVYTFVWTMTLAMQACRAAGVRFVVLDRPNPITGTIREGPVLEAGFESFVGLHRVPLRHGLTAGELARLANSEFGIGCDLDVVALENWDRSSWFDETGLPWVLPSPNLPTLDSCVVYPGMVLLEGTNLSEGRGTTRPFELFGAPYLDPDRLIGALAEKDLSGVTLRPCWFEPTFQKHAGQLCGGAQLHVTDRRLFRPVRTAVSILSTVRELAPDDFRWLSPPYEYEHERMPIDILWGGDGLRTTIDAGDDTGSLLAAAAVDVRAFEELAGPSLLYQAGH